MELEEQKSGLSKFADNAVGASKVIGAIPGSAVIAPNIAAIGTSLGRGAQALEKLGEGDQVGAAAKAIGAGAEIATTMAAVAFPPAGLLLGAGTLFSKFTTGKFISTHVGEMVEGAAENMMGGDKSSRQMPPQPSQYGQPVGQFTQRIQAERAQAAAQGLAARTV